MHRKIQFELAVTGATGFIARGVLEWCSELGLSCLALSRSTRPSWTGQAIDWLTVPSYGDGEALEQALHGVKYVLHLADNSKRDITCYPEEAINNSRALIAAARASHVQGIILASSVYAREGAGKPRNSYGAVKQTVEDYFLSEGQGIKTIVLRLPPVYGPGGGGGLAALSTLIRKRVPLPLALATAPRSYLSRRNLASLIATIVNADENLWKNADNLIFEPSDGKSISTRDLARAIAAYLDTSLILLPIPVGLLRLIAAVTGTKGLVSGAVEELDVALPQELEHAFGWRPIERIPDSLEFLRQEDVS